MTCLQWKANIFLISNSWSSVSIVAFNLEDCNNKNEENKDEDSIGVYSEGGSLTL